MKNGKKEITAEEKEMLGKNGPLYKVKWLRCCK